MKYIVFAICFDATYNKTKKGNAILSNGLAVRKENPVYVNQLYKELKDSLDEIAHQMSKQYGRNVKYDILNKDLHKVYDFELNIEDIKNIENIFLMYVAFYAEPEFYNTDSIYNEFNKYTLLNKQDKLNVELLSNESNEFINTDVTVKSKLYLWHFHSAEIDRLSNN